MSSPNQVGSYGVVASFDGGVSFVVSGTARLIEPNSATLQRTAKRLDTMNSDGETVNVLFWDFGKSVSIRCYPRGSSRANASTVNNVDIKPGTLILLYSLSSSAQEDEVLAATSNDSGATGGTLYFVASFSKTHEAGNKVVYDMTLEKPDAMTVAAIS
jgi:hypothetical protein